MDDEIKGPATLIVTPAGHVRLVPAESGVDGVIDALPRRVRQAFVRSAGVGLLYLGAAELGEALPLPVAWFREFARTYVALLCAAPDLEELRERITIAPPPGTLDQFAARVPPMLGAEYVTVETLGAIWATIEAAFQEEIAAFDGTPAEYLRQQNPLWSLVGRVCFHLAEQKHDAARPFAFLATYSTRVAGASRVQHRPLAQAVKASASAGEKKALLSLLVPVQRAAEKSTLIREMLDSGEVYHPQAWTPATALRFLRDVPAFESAGVVVRVPDWWKARRAPRPQVNVTVGSNAPSGLGLDALLDFRVEVALDGEVLTEAELREIQRGSDGLVRLRGKWVEMDRAKLGEVLAHWKQVQQAAGQDGLSFIEGMRLMAGAPIGSSAGESAVDATRAWTGVSPGPWLAATLAEMRATDAAASAAPPDLRATLRHYQDAGVRWLQFLTRLGLGACLADDMGLGKTIQVLALLLHERRRVKGGGSLLVVPASLVGNWQSEIERFAPSLRVFIAHPSVTPAARLAQLTAADLGGSDLVITTYGTLVRVPGLAAVPWRLVILDEAQAIKNPGTRQTRAVKALQAKARIALTGTPIENRLGDLWSLFDFLNPGLLGNGGEFTRYAKALERGNPPDFSPLRRLVGPYILRRLKTDKSVIADLPDKTEVRAYCALSKVQAVLYEGAVRGLAEKLKKVSGIERRGLVLSLLLRLKQICNHPAQFRGDGDYAPALSGKFDRLTEIAESIAAKQEKVLIFTQFREMTDPLATHLAAVFGRPGLTLHGETPVAQRKRLVDRFQADEAVPFFVLSVKAGGTGLNLTAASHVVHFDRWWNPAVEDQATDRAFRIGQKRNVLVHKFVCPGTVEERVDAMITAKRGLAREVLSGAGEISLTELGDRELIDFVALDLTRAMGEG